MGEGEKLVRAVFSLARKISPCVVFIDEIDSLLAARHTSRTGSDTAHRGVVTEFMQVRRPRLYIPRRSVPTLLGNGWLKE